jgi:hypothetical protein
LNRYDEENCYIDYFIHQEHLERDFINVFKTRRVSFTPEQTEINYGTNKKNRTKKKHAIGVYYDQKNLDLVAQHEKLIINKFKYYPPALSALK